MVREYCENLYDMLAGCLSGKYKRSQYQQEKMWTKYCKLRASRVYGFILLLLPWQVQYFINT